MDNFESNQEQFIKIKKRINHKSEFIYITMLVLIGVMIKYTINICSKNVNVNASLAVMLLIISIILVIIFAAILENSVNKKDKKIYNSLYNQMQGDYKNLVLNTFKNVFSNVIYEEKKGIKEKDVESIELIDTGDRFHSNDYLSASYKDVDFKYSDIHIEEEHSDTDEDGHTHTYYVTTFLGQWYEFEFNKTFKSDVKVFELFSDSLKNNRNRVLLEDVDFNNNFYVQAKNDIDAFYILTPNVMEKIKEISKKIDGHISMCFMESKLYIAVNSGKDMFEINVYNKFNLQDELKKINDNIKIICDFVEILDLDNDLFKNE